MFAAIHFLGSNAQAEQGPIWLEVLQGDRILVVYAGETVLHRYPIGLGPRPVGDKTRGGDGATPESKYSICVKNPSLLSFSRSELPGLRRRGPCSRRGSHRRVRASIALDDADMKELYELVRIGTPVVIEP